MPALRPLRRDETSFAAALLGRAFEGSPTYASILSHIPEARRIARISRCKRGFVESVMRHRDATVVEVDASSGPSIVGVSLVVPPGRYPPSLVDEALRASGCATTGPRAIVRFLRYAAHTSRRHIHEPHFYLFALGIEPAHQGRGFGKQLLAALNERADRAGVACYLETDKISSVRIYESVGYGVETDETIAPLDGLRCWTMRRPARA